MKKTGTILAIVLCAVMTLTACGGSGKSSGGGSSDVSLTYNGVTIKLGDTFSDYESKLGEQTMPSQEIPPCDGEGDTMTVYTYDSLTINVDESGKIDSINLAEGGDAAANAQTDKGLKLGDPADKAKELYGEAMTDTEFVLNIHVGGSVFGMSKDDSGNISSFYIMQAD